MTHPPSGPLTPSPPAGPRVDEYVALLLVLEASLDGWADALTHLPKPTTLAEENAQVVLEFRLKAARLAVVELLHLAAGRSPEPATREPRPFPEFTMPPTGEGFSLPATPPAFTLPGSIAEQVAENARRRTPC